MCNSSRDIGDLFLLFQRLPYDFKIDLPIPLGPGIYLDDTPQDILASVDPPALADYVLPGYNLPGMGITNCCIRASGSYCDTISPKPKDLLFLAILGLRLQAPISIEVAGKFELGPEDDPIKKPESFGMLSSWHPYHGKEYTTEDIKNAEKIVNIIIQLEKLNEKRLVSAIILFSHSSCGFSKSLQLAYLGLFSAIEALFMPKGNKAKSLAKRVSSYLSSFDGDGTLESWLQSQYIHERSQIAHGIQNVNPWIKIRKSKHDNYGRLHEVVRLCLLGFLSLHFSEIINLAAKKGNNLQKELDKLPPAKGIFIEGQSMWLG